eukprot:COSAG01_NODE_397_length_17560_cov_111.258347_15_plen_194_part_00
MKPQRSTGAEVAGSVRSGRPAHIQQRHISPLCVTTARRGERRGGWQTTQAHHTERERVAESTPGTRGSGMSARESNTPGSAQEPLCLLCSAQSAHLLPRVLHGPRRARLISTRPDTQTLQMLVWRRRRWVTNCDGSLIAIIIISGVLLRCWPGRTHVDVAAQLRAEGFRRTRIIANAVGLVGRAANASQPLPR